MSSATEQEVINMQWHAAHAAELAEHERKRPFMLLRPRMMPDGNMWCALYGDNLHDGVAGFGETPEAAARQFDIEWLNAKAGPPRRPTAWIWHYRDGTNSLRWRPDHDPTSTDVPERVTPLYLLAARDDL